MGFKSNTWVAVLRPAPRRFPGLMQLRCNCVVTHLESSGSVDPEARLVLTRFPWIDAFQVEIWETLEAPIPCLDDADD